MASGKARALAVIGLAEQMGQVSVMLTFRIQVQVRPDRLRYLLHVLREFMFGIGSRSNEEELVSFNFGFILSPDKRRASFEILGEATRR